MTDPILSESSDEILYSSDSETDSLSDYDDEVPKFPNGEGPGKGPGEGPSKGPSKGPGKTTVKTKTSGITFLGMFVGIILALILVHLWTRAFDLVVFQRLQISKNSATWAVLIAIFATIFFLMIIWLFNQYGLNSVEKVIVADSGV